MINILENTHSEWQPLLKNALNQMDTDYLIQLQADDDWLPGKNSLLAAFSTPLSSVRYVLLGESPYPRSQSANGFAFWDQSVGSLWGAKGLSKEVNRATSLRNMLKMLLFARGDITEFSQETIMKLDKSHYLQTGADLFQSMIGKGFLLLNATLVFSKGKVNYHARHWRPFIHSLFEQLAGVSPSLKLILLGRVAQEIPEAGFFPSLIAEHPYNISFITNPEVVNFFKPLDLLRYEKYNNSR